MTRPITQTFAARLFSKSAAEGKAPVAVFGSGLLAETGFSRAAEWPLLLKAIAKELSLPFRPDLAKGFPTLYWESMLFQAAHRHGTKAAGFEKRAQRIVARLIRNERPETIHPLGSISGAKRLHSIISLNFTAHPFVGPDFKAHKDPTISHYESNGRTIWCVHGDLSHPPGIRLGARKYGLLLTDLEEWRQEYHIHRKHRSATGDVPPLSGGGRFMKDVLEHPLVFAGCGLSESEWTLWWLLSTKARNSARHNAYPSVFVTMAGKKNDRTQNHAERVLRHELLAQLNCRVLLVSNYREVWASVRSLIGG